MDVRSDFLLIGGGIAGSRAARRLADFAKVVLLTKAIQPRAPLAMRRTALRRRSVSTIRPSAMRATRRGGHFRTDFPNRDDIHWRKHVFDALARA